MFICTFFKMFRAAFKVPVAETCDKFDSCMFIFMYADQKTATEYYSLAIAK